MPPYNVLFLCTGNSARSIMAEAVLRSKASGRFHVFSAGSHPRGAVHPLALTVLKMASLPIEGLRCKSWDEFAGPGAPPLHFVFTVCGNAAKEQCPVWPGHPITAHWGIDDPAVVEGTKEEQLRGFQRAFRDLSVRIQLFASLRLEALETLALQQQLDAIGRLKSDE